MIDRVKEYLESFLEKVPKPFKNFFVFTTILFVLWMLFLDVDSIPRQWRKYRANKELIQESEFYQEKIKKSKDELQGLKNDPEKLERLAREKYYMHKKTEDVYVIEKEEVKE